VQAIRFARRFEQVMEALVTGQAAEGEDPTRCPSCHAPLPPDSDECPICTRELNTPPSTWVLLRLWRFARPYQGSCWPASC
jgi:ATP-binding cassette subfamily B protein